MRLFTAILQIFKRGRTRRPARLSAVLFFCKLREKAKITLFDFFSLRRMDGERKEDEFGAFFNRRSPKNAPKKEKTAPRTNARTLFSP
ncbi:MAG TPA: hypothetical protein H9741_04080 [Candidatus Borkfalkia faecipullorum]|uniref:Uncharacterized protein n=1 Tax=Candidatus Borkfalkia faecipullorum TaxID=2838510 RepID=A0A9D1V7N0_9FIRM|nr:hypothetical protein [Candidatus Borkfalkia faecipullorum]